MRRYRRPILLALLVLACLVSLVAYDRHRQRREDAIEWTIARMPLGISGAEAERRIGQPPDKVMRGRGVIAYSAIMFDASSAQAKEYGEPQMYESRIWYLGSLTVVVHLDRNDRVALRTASRPRPRPSVLGRLRRFLQNLL